MTIPDVGALTGYVDELLYDAQRVMEELDPFTDGTYPEVYSVLSWLLPLAEESRVWATGLQDALELFNDESDSFTPVIAMKLVLAHYDSVRQRP